MRSQAVLVVLVQVLAVAFLGTAVAEPNRYPPGVEASDSLLKSGLLDVTKKPYLADPKGTADATEAIRAAINDARDFGLVCFFPAGTYLISDTLSCEQQNYKLEKPRPVDGSIANYWHKNHKIVMLGSTGRGKRPVLKLARDAKGFDDPANPKIAVHIWARTWFGDGTGEQPNISFGHSFIGIDIDVTGHAGAIGLKHSGSQGCTLQDATIFAEGAFAGLHNCPGQAAGTYNVEIIGGEYGLFADSHSRFPILIGCRFRNQTKAAIGYTRGGTQVPTLVVGSLFENQSGKVIDLTTEPKYAGITLVDCVIRMKGGVVAATAKPENIFIENTYIEGADGVSTGDRGLPKSSRWILVDRYSSHVGDAVSLLNGRESTEGSAEWKAVNLEPDWPAIRSRHLKPRPSLEDKDVLNVKDFGALGDGTNDDSDAFERAIAAGNKVFVPPGDYRLTRDLDLRRNTVLFSVSEFLTSIGTGRRPSAHDSLQWETPRAERDSFTLSTPDDAEASPGLWFVSVRGRVNWRSGKGFLMHLRSPLEFSGNAGGNIHAMVAMGEQFVVEDTRNPLSFYSLNVERVTTNPQSLIRNSAKVRIYYFKVEAGTRNSGETGGGDENTPGTILNSEDVRIYCMYGNVKGLSGERAMLEVIDSRKIQVSQLKAFFPGVFPHLKETLDGVVHILPSDRICALFVRD